MSINLPLFSRFLRITAVKLSRYITKEISLLYKEPDGPKMSYYHRVIHLSSREVTNTKYDTMKEIVDYVYYNIPDSPNYIHMLICHNNYNGKEHGFLLRQNKSIISNPDEQNQRVLPRRNQRRQPATAKR